MQLAKSNLLYTINKSEVYDDLHIYQWWHTFFFPNVIAENTVYVQIVECSRQKGQLRQLCYRIKRLCITTVMFIIQELHWNDVWPKMYIRAETSVVFSFLDDFYV